MANQYKRDKMVPFPSQAIFLERDLYKRPILETRHLGIDFGGLTAVDDFNIVIGRTEISGLIGPNGAGKTTVFNLLTKVYQPTRGMWVWNDYLLPYLVLDRTKYMTIPILVQYLKGSYGTVDLGATMAVIMMSIIPIIILYLFCQKHIIKGVAAGAVKG